MRTNRTIALVLTMLIAAAMLANDTATKAMIRRFAQRLVRDVIALPDPVVQPDRAHAHPRRSALVCPALGDRGLHPDLRAARALLKADVDLDVVQGARPRQALAGFPDGDAREFEAWVHRVRMTHWALVAAMMAIGCGSPDGASRLLTSESLAEFALAAPLFLLVFLGIAEGGYYVVEDGHVDIERLHPDGPPEIRQLGVRSGGVNAAIADWLETLTGSD